MSLFIFLSLVFPNVTQILPSEHSGLQETISKLQHQLKTEREEHGHQVNQLQKQFQGNIEQLQRKCQCLTKLFEEVRARYERRESRQEDLNIISDLKQVIAEQEKDLACLNEEKRYFQMKLMNLERFLEFRGPSTDENDFEIDCHYPENSINNTPSKLMPNGLGQDQACGFSIPPTIPECDDDYDD